jgi:hypothetical protein
MNILKDKAHVMNAWPQESTKSVVRQNVIIILRSKN